MMSTYAPKAGKLKLQSSKLKGEGRSENVHNDILELYEVTVAHPENV